MTDLHLLYGLLDAEIVTLTKLLVRSGADVAGLPAELESELAKLPEVRGEAAQLHMSPALARILAEADSWAKQRGDSFIAADAVLLALAGKGDTAGKLLKKQGLDTKKLAEAIDEMRGGRQIDSDVGDELFETLEKYASGPDRCCCQGRAGPGHWPG